MDSVSVIMVPITLGVDGEQVLWVQGKGKAFPLHVLHVMGVSGE